MRVGYAASKRRVYVQSANGSPSRASSVVFIFDSVFFNAVFRGAYSLEGKSNIYTSHDSAWNSKSEVGLYDDEGEKNEKGRVISGLY